MRRILLHIFLFVSFSCWGNEIRETDKITKLNDLIKTCKDCVEIEILSEIDIPADVDRFYLQDGKFTLTPNSTLPLCLVALKDSETYKRRVRRGKIVISNIEGSAIIVFSLSNSKTFRSITCIPHENSIARFNRIGKQIMKLRYSEDEPQEVDP